MRRIFWTDSHYLPRFLHDNQRAYYTVMLFRIFSHFSWLKKKTALDGWRSLLFQNSLSPTMAFISIAYCCNIYTIFYITCFYADLASLEVSYKSARNLSEGREVKAVLWVFRAKLCSETLSLRAGTCFRGKFELPIKLLFSGVRSLCNWSPFSYTPSDLAVSEG